VTDAAPADTAPLLSSQQLAEYLQVPVQTVYDWAARGTGPARHKVGRYSRYRRADVEAWLDAQKVTSAGSR